MLRSPASRALPFAALVVTAVPLALAARSFVVATREFHPQRVAVQRSESGLVDVRFTAAGAELHGWLCAPRNGAAVILLHGSESDRRQLLPEADLLVRHGYGALLYDAPGCGESGGSVRYGYPEREALRAAVDLLARRPEVRHIGVIGFSMGATIAAQVVPGEPRVGALVLEGVVLDLAAQARWESRRWGALSQMPAVWAKRWSGWDGLVVSQGLAGLAPRPLLLIAGAADTQVPIVNTMMLYAQAREPKQLWIVAGAAHGGYATVAGDEYESRLVAFFDRAWETRR